MNRRWEAIKESVYSGHEFYNKVKENYNLSRCYDCGKENCVTEIHHRIPKKFGGSDEIENLIPLCRECHKETFVKNVWTLKKYIIDNQN
jgi:5-methylcytosine-specific restriction endonuclease McrA